MILTVLLLCALLVAAAVVWAGARIGRELAARGENRELRVHLLTLFSPGMAAAGQDPRALLVWQPIATTARALFPKEFADLDHACGHTFPFSATQIENAHARWTADWLTWERSHDAECKLRSASVEHDLGDAVGSAYGRARMDAVESQKLDQYQRRYEEYTRVAKALQALLPRA